MQSRTDAFAALADAIYNEPVLLVRAYLAGGTRCWTSRAGTYGGQVYEELLKQGADVQIGLDKFGRTTRGAGSLVLANEPQGGDTTGARLSDLFATEVLANAEIQIDQAFLGLNAPDWLRVYKGVIEVPEEDCFDDQEVRLNLIDDGNPLHDGIRGLSPARIHKVLGEVIGRDEYPSADPDAIGKIKPEIFGSLDEAPGYPVDAGALDVLAADITSSQTTIPLSDGDVFEIWPSSGTGQIEDEQFTWSGKDTGTLTLTGCTRHTGGTATAAHVAGRQVWEVKAEYKYLVARHACKSLTNVRVDGVLLTSGYTVDLTGPTLIKFSIKPKTSLSVSVTQQPDYSASTVSEQSPGTISTISEQSPGSISTTSEQTPGSISTTGEHGHSTDTGSHAHVGSSSVQQLASSESFPQTITGNHTYNFGDVGGDTACVWKVVWDTGSIGSGATIRYAVGSHVDQWTYPNLPPKTYLYSGGVGENALLITVTGGTFSLAIQEVSRVVQYAPDTGSSAATGVSTSRTGATATSMASLAGATAESMASLAGATASSMATLAGSTAVSLAQVQNTIVSPADIQVGQQVICDVEGIRDDGAGTYTGTPNALITNPADQLQYLIAVHLGMTLADWVDSASFLQARADFAAAGIRADWGIYDLIDSAELFERLRWSVASRLFLSAEGKFKLILLPPGGSSVKTITESDDVLSPSYGGHPIKVGRTQLVDLYNLIYLLYQKNVTGSGYRSYVQASSTPSQTTYRTVGTLMIENDFVRDETAADAIALKYLNWHKDQKWRATLPVWGLPNIHLEPMDKIAITSPRMPGGWVAEEFYIESIRKTLAQSGNPSSVDKVILVCRGA